MYGGTIENPLLFMTHLWESTSKNRKKYVLKLHIK
jgi:hypothetical protein